MKNKSQMSSGEGINSKNIEINRRYIESGRTDSGLVQEMVETNMGLVYKIAWPFSRRSGGKFSIDELVNEGSTGLKRAAEKFDYRGEVRFSSYASYRIRQPIYKAISQASDPIRIPINLKSRITKMMKEIGEYTKLYDSPPDEGYLAEVFNVDIKTIRAWKSYLHKVVSSEQLSEDGNYFEIDTPAEDFSSEVIKKIDSKRFVAKALSYLPERERKIIVLRYGLNGTGPMTLKEIGEEIGTSGENVRGIQNNAIKKMRTQMEKLMGDEFYTFFEE